jgi:hypothetical protein
MNTQSLSHLLQQRTICDVYCDTNYIRFVPHNKHAVLYIVMDEITKFYLIDYSVQYVMFIVTQTTLK